MRGKTVVITGATAGIGKEAALELARRGAELAIIARNPEKAAAVTAEITAAAPGTSVHVFRADLAVLENVRTVAAEVSASLERVDVLINNAGIAARASRVTPDGYDEMLEANYLGPFLLTHLLLDRVTAAAPSRIVIVGSEAHRASGRLDPESFENFGTYSGVAAQLAYGRTKLLDILFADELARRLDGTKVTVNSLCPGLVATELAREVGPTRAADTIGRLLSATPFMRTPAQGARMTVKLASDPEVEGITGKFWSSTPGAPLLPAVRARRDPAIARRIYERTCALLGIPEVPAPLDR